jgi:dTMP kinase
MFIVIEGIDGCGKSTQIQWLQRWLQQEDTAFWITKEPTDSMIGEVINASLKYHQNQYSPLVQLLLFTADRLHHVDKINTYLEKGIHVICDRFLDSTYAYQASTDSLKEVFSFHEKTILEKCKPDITLFLDVPIDIAIGRVYQRGAIECFENQKFLQSVRERYYERIQKNPQWYQMIDGNTTPQIVFSKIQDILLQYMKGDK